MGQFGIVEGLILLFLHEAAVMAALLAAGLRISTPREIKESGSQSAFTVPHYMLICIVTFACAFAAHIFTFILLPDVAEGAARPDWHRLVVADIWATVAALVAWIMLPRMKLKGAIFSYLFTGAAYLLFIYVLADMISGQ